MDVSQMTEREIYFAAQAAREQRMWLQADRLYGRRTLSDRLATVRYHLQVAWCRVRGKPFFLN